MAPCSLHAVLRPSNPHPLCSQTEQDKKGWGGRPFIMRGHSWAMILTILPAINMWKRLKKDRRGLSGWSVPGILGINTQREFRVYENKQTKLANYDSLLWSHTLMFERYLETENRIDCSVCYKAVQLFFSAAVPQRKNKTSTVLGWPKNILFRVKLKLFTLLNYHFLAF